MTDDSEPIAWFFQNLFKPLFSHAEVLALAGERLKHDTLQNWANRKYIEPKMIKGKRRYTALEVATIILAQPLVLNLEMTPTAATLSITTGMLIFHRKLKSKEASLKEAPHLVFVYTRSFEEPVAFDSRRAAPEIFEHDEAFIVVPIGRMSNDLAVKQKQLVESRSMRRAG